MYAFFNTRDKSKINYGNHSKIKKINPTLRRWFIKIATVGSGMCQFFLHKRVKKGLSNCDTSSYLKSRKYLWKNLLEYYLGHLNMLIKRSKGNQLGHVLSSLNKGLDFLDLYLTLLIYCALLTARVDTVNDFLLKKLILTIWN